jgi:urea transporter
MQNTADLGTIAANMLVCVCVCVCACVSLCVSVCVCVCASVRLRIEQYSHPSISLVFLLQAFFLLTEAAGIFTTSILLLAQPAEHGGPRHYCGQCAS